MILFLILLIFISKVAVSFFGIFPRQFDPFIFQYGLHPYMNIFFNSLVGGFLTLWWFWRSHHLFQQSRFYRFLMYTTSLYLILVTLLQCFFVNPDESFILQMASAFMAVFTLYLYGRVIPTSYPPEKFLKSVKLITVFLCWVSLALLFLSPATSFKGTRFIGAFKHIPHMVSCATLACFAIYYSIFVQKISRFRLAVNYFNLLLCFSLLVLTGTRSALAAVLVGFVLCLLFFPSGSWLNRFIKVSMSATAFLVVMFFGHPIADYLVQVVRGEQAIANRAAQDGFKSRLEEIERGFVMFEKNRWLGQGLLMKFSTGQEADISGYDANKDPHNIFVSAGVIGGWGFVLLCTLGYFALALATLKTLFSKNQAMRLIAIYMLTSLPIILIYHVHLSLGGIADRVYWIVIGYIAIKENS